MSSIAFRSVGLTSPLTRLGLATDRLANLCQLAESISIPGCGSSLSHCTVHNLLSIMRSNFPVPPQQTGICLASKGAFLIAQPTSSHSEFSISLVCNTYAKSLLMVWLLYCIYLILVATPVEIHCNASDARKAGPKAHKVHHGKLAHFTWVLKAQSVWAEYRDDQMSDTTCTQKTILP